MFYIAKETLSSAVSSITFSSISTAYKHLCVKISARQGAENAFNIQFNGNTGANYSYQLFGSDSSSVAHSSASSVGSIIARGINTSVATSSIFGNTEFYIPDYTNTSKVKTLSIDGVNENNDPNIYYSIGAGSITGTSAISSITISSRAGNLEQYSTFYLYGLN